jgi:hypothetical protein
MIDEFCGNIPLDVIDEYQKILNYSRTHNTWNVEINYITESEPIKYIDEKTCVD